MEQLTLSPEIKANGYQLDREPFFHAQRSTLQAPRLHVAIVDEELPYPATSGKRIRTLNLTLRLARRHRITYFCHRNADIGEARQAAVFFADHGIETVVVDRVVPPKRGPKFYARLATNLLSPLPYSVASHTSPALNRAIQDYAAENAVDLWHCEWTPYFEPLRRLVAARRLVMAHNVESLIWQRYCETEKNRLKRWYMRRQWRKFEHFEKRTFAEADQTVAVSFEDASLMRSRFRAGNVAVVENGVDVSFFQPADERRQLGRILFLGSLDWRPNLDAVNLLLNAIFPLVETLEPSARLCLVGRNPPEWLRRKVNGTPAVELHANVPDVRPYLAQCGILAVPLRIGGGSRIKILEALASGLPVVSTRVGAEGLSLQAGDHFVLVDRVEDMANALVQTIRGHKKALQAAERGRRMVLCRYDWDVLAEQLETVWIRCVKNDMSEALEWAVRGRKPSDSSHSTSDSSPLICPKG